MPRSDLPPLNSLLPFEAVVRHGSVTRAARELHLTHGAVSRQIQHLERALGTRLFERTARAMVPTAAAVRLADVVRDAFDQIGAAARQVARGGEAGPLALSYEPTLLMRWLIPRLPGLAGLEPSLALHLSAGGGPVSFARDGVDAAIRREDFAVPEGVGRTPLFDEYIGPVCRPGLAAGLTDPARLSGVTLLHTRTRPGAWPEWLRLTGAAVEAAGEQTFEHFYLSLQAAVAGLGVAIGPYALVQDDLARGQLVAPFGFVADGTCYQLLTARPLGHDARLVRLVEWLRTHTARLTPAAEAQAAPRMPLPVQTPALAHVLRAEPPSRQIAQRARPRVPSGARQPLVGDEGTRQAPARHPGARQVAGPRPPARGRRRLGPVGADLRRRRPGPGDAARRGRLCGVP
ncbi:LysR substrate-binding domain-containing protein [Streptomyces sp. XD-27]|uniref:LysR substrate-binding domain-containing protein n=1 Tax=Streptomyces sp. XD-27 TaxID=3062779 RepID=UPI0026F45686|nr:LysR substrate-binding domain-containing protein [Streptomyces sp. XD-27]WKX68717.1 LysR substrate-binding domain-containing protein [Streptomyces sp. XD-27]